MAKDFYDKIAKKFGGYGYGISPQYISEYPVGEPEKVFKERLLGLSSKNKIALDIDVLTVNLPFLLHHLSKKYMELTLQM